MSDKFNILMPESEGSTLCYEITKPISAEGYEENFLRLARQIIKEYGELRILTYFSNYQGWEEKAAMMDIVSFVEFGSYLKKIAFVNAPEKEIMGNLILKPLISKAELKFFPKSDLAMAIDWVKA